MKRAVLDTHALVWYLSAPKKLGKRAAHWLRQGERGQAEILVPMAVGWELVLLREAGRKIIGLAELNELLVAKPAFRLLPPDAAQLYEFSLLGPIRDAFDRFMVAAARASQCSLLTADGLIHESGLVDTVWDQ